MRYWHMYGGWMPPVEGRDSRINMRTTKESDDKFPPVVIQEDGFLKSKEPIPLALWATWDHQPTEREQEEALPEVMRSGTLEWDHELSDDEIDFTGVAQMDCLDDGGTALTLTIVGPEAEKSASAYPDRPDVVFVDVHSSMNDARRIEDHPTAHLIGQRLRVQISRVP